MLKKTIFLLVVLNYPSFCAESAAEDFDLSQEQEVKAALVHYLGKFVSWPVDRGNDQLTTFCLVEPDDLSLRVKKSLAKSQVGARKVAFREISDPGKEQLEDCEVVLISQRGHKHASVLRRRLKGESVLMICIHMKLYWQDCPMQVYEKDEKAKIGVDLALIEGSGLYISSELLGIVEVKKN